MEQIKSILVTAATKLEISDLVYRYGRADAPTGYKYGNLDIEPLVTGIGLIPSAYSLMKRLSSGPRPDLIINAGIAGSFVSDLQPGTVVNIVRDRFADFGIDSNGCFIDIFESGLMEQSEFPFKNGWVYSGAAYLNVLKDQFRSVSGITVNCVSGSEERIKMLMGKFNPEIETMESAVFFYICAREKIPCIAIRSVSNMVEPRNRGNWEIPLALKNLVKGVEKVITTIGG